MPTKTRVSQERRNAPTIKRACIYCETGTEPIYTDTATLRKFMNDRARISLRGRTGLCSRHQRRATKEIKHARHLALLPFVPTA